MSILKIRFRILTAGVLLLLNFVFSNNVDAQAFTANGSFQPNYGRNSLRVYWYGGSNACISAYYNNVYIDINGINKYHGSWNYPLGLNLSTDINTSSYKPGEVLKIIATVRFQGFLCDYPVSATPFTVTVPSYQPITNLQATDNIFSTKIDLTWSRINEVSYDSLKYKVYENGIFLVEVPGTQFNYSRTGLSHAMSRTYTVRAVANGVELPAIPSDQGSTFSLSLQATTNSADRVLLTWNNFNGTGSPTGYTIDRIVESTSNYGFLYNSTDCSYVAYEDRASSGLIPGYMYTYRLRVNPSTTNEFFRIANGKILPNGKISGKVLTPFPGNVPVAGIKVQAKLVGAALPTDTTTTYVTTTNLQGYYEFNNIYYYKAADFIITPSADKRLFDPGNKTVNLAINNNSNTANFTDLSSFTIAGNISNGTCPVAGVNITIGNDTIAITDSLGNYRTTVNIGGTYLIKPKLTDHAFNPSQKSVNVSANVVDVNFIDTTKYFVKGKIAASCNTTIGRGAIRFYSTDKTSPCFDQTINTDENGNYSIWLPSQKYYYKLTSFTSANPTQPKALDVLAFFSKPRLLDISKYNADIFKHDTLTVDLTYGTPPVLKMSQIGYTSTCSGVSIPLVKRYEPLDISFSAFDDFQANQCPAAGGIIIIRENISSFGMTENIDTLEYKKGEVIPYKLIPGTPNLIEAQGYKKFFEAILIRDGQSDTVYTEVIVLGDVPREKNFTTVSPQIPFHILHNPPGDASYSFLEATKSITSSFSNTFQWDASVDAYVRVQLGPSISLETGFLGIAGASIQQEITANVTGTLGVGSSGLTDWATSLTTSVAELYKTSDNVNITGGAGDVYIGGAMNMLYGISDILTYDFINSLYPQIILSELFADVFS